MNIKGSTRRRASASMALVMGMALVISATPPATAGHDRVTGGFTAEAPPGAGCELGVNEAAETFKTPFGGFLYVEMTGFMGDWDLYLRDAEGVEVKSSTSSNDPVFGTPGEKIGVWLGAQREYSIVACNWAGSRTAEVTYSFTHLAPPKPLPAPKRKIKRTWVGEYTGPGIGTALTGAQLCHYAFGIGCAATDAYALTDRYVTAKVTDASGLPVAAAVYQSAGDDSGPTHSFCGATDEPIKLMPEVDWVGVELLIGPCLDATPAAVTTGEVELTFSNLP